MFKGAALGGDGFAILSLDGDSARAVGSASIAASRARVRVVRECVRGRALVVTPAFAENQENRRQV